MSAAVETTPGFTFRSTVFWDELDAIGVLHNSRFAAHVERAVIAWYESHGKRWEQDLNQNPDQFHVVREFRIEFLQPVRSGIMRVEFWVERLGHTSCLYGFLCSSEDGRTIHARGSRAIVKLDPATLRPAPWSDFFRHAHASLLRSD